MYSVSVDLLSLQHIRILKLFLGSFGAWPGEILGEKNNLLIRILRKAAPLQTIFFLFFQINYIIAESPHLDSFEISDLFIGIFLGLLTAMYHKAIMVSEYFTKFMMVSALVGLILFNISPIYNNYRNGAYSGHNSENVTYQFAVYYKLPGCQTDDHFKILTFLNFFHSWMCGISVCTLDLYLCLMVIQIIAHLKVLNYNIQDISHKSITYVKYTEEENDAIHMRIKSCVDHHRIIMKFVDAMSEFFGLLLGFNYAFQLCVLCLLLLELSSMTALAIIRYGPLSFIIFGQLIMISVIFEVVSSESNKLSDTVYSTPWEQMDIRNQTSICIILRRIQEPLKVTAAGMADVSVRTMAAILKTTFSYFAFLKSKN